MSWIIHLQLAARNIGTVGGTALHQSVVVGGGTGLYQSMVVGDVATLYQSMVGGKVFIVQVNNGEENE